MQKEYTCEHCKKAPRNGIYKRNFKWKTEKGFLNHPCWKDILEQRKKNEENEKTRKEKELSDWILKAKYKVCDSVYYLSYYVTKPTHEQRGNRIVKVRYEEERKYCRNSGHVQCYLPQGYMINNEHVFECDIGTIEEVDKRVKSNQEGYDEHCKFSSSVR
jgi:alpha-galactosidase/6-phospho-beta-glucosidase family protein